MKNYFVYTDEEVKGFNHVTVVKGSLNAKGSAKEELKDKLHEVVYTNDNIPSFITKTGRSKCSSEDTYNEKTGLIVASRKAELKANKEMLKEVTEARKAAEEYLTLIKDMEDKLDYKVGKLELDLIVFNRGEVK